MGYQRYRLMLSSTRIVHLVSIQTIGAGSLEQAELRATNLLRARRLMSPEGLAWDRWDLGGRVVGQRGWHALAKGGHEGTTETVRDRKAHEADRANR